MNELWVLFLAGMLLAAVALFRERIRRRNLRRHLAVLADEGVYCASRRGELIPALFACGEEQRAILDHRREAIVALNLPYLETLRQGVEDGDEYWKGKLLLEGMVRAYLHDSAFFLGIVAQLEGETSSDVWGEILYEIVEKMDYSTPAAVLADAKARWLRLPVDAPARTDESVQETFTTWELELTIPPSV